jgi:hypothetical protein
MIRVIVAASCGVTGRLPTASQIDSVSPNYFRQLLVCQAMHIGYILQFRSLGLLLVRGVQVYLRRSVTNIDLALHHTTVLSGLPSPLLSTLPFAPFVPGCASFQDCFVPLPVSFLFFFTWTQQGKLFCHDKLQLTAAPFRLGRPTNRLSCLCGLCANFARCQRPS